MYRITSRNEELILRFWPKLGLDLPQKEQICRAITAGMVDIEKVVSNRNALLFLEELGAVAIDVEKLPSVVMTVTAVVPRNRWYSNEAQ